MTSLFPLFTWNFFDPCHSGVLFVGHKLPVEVRMDPGGCPNLITFLYFLFDDGIDDPNTTINGLSPAHQRNAILMAFRCWTDDGLTLNAGLVAL